MERILTKAESIRRFLAGEFGNRTLVYRASDHVSYKELLEVDLFGVRLARRYPQIAFDDSWFPNLRQSAMFDWVIDLEAAGVAPRDIIVAEMAPTHRVTLNAEVMRSERHIDMRYSTVKLPLRESLSAGERCVSGLQAKMLLEWHLDAASQENLWALLDRYPDSVVELSAYDVGCGVLGWNTLFWEVRNY